VEKCSRIGQARDYNMLQAHCHWIPKVTNTHSKYVTVNAFTPQEWLHERASKLRYRSTRTSFFDGVYAVYKNQNRQGNVRIT
jgi:hypothetical protein